MVGQETRDKGLCGVLGGFLHVSMSDQSAQIYIATIADSSDKNSMIHGVKDGHFGFVLRARLGKYFV